MPSERTALNPSALPRGTFAPSGPNDKRSPCPIVNCLANHGYISRDGKNIRAGELNAAMNVVGLSAVLGACFAQPIFNEYQDPKKADLRKKPGLLVRIWSVICNPWLILASFGMRRPGQIDAAGKKVIDLDQLALPGVVEHDVSLSRRDYLQKEGNVALQKDLVREILAASSDNETLTLEDLAALRKRRIQQQTEDNPGLKYGSREHQLGCGEISLILDVFGNGKSVPCSYVRSIFNEERLPVQEGWTKRRWWTLGFLELEGTVRKVKKCIGLQI